MTETFNTRPYLVTGSHGAVWSYRVDIHDYLFRFTVEYGWTIHSPGALPDTFADPDFRAAFDEFTAVYNAFKTRYKHIQWIGGSVLGTVGKDASMILARPMTERIAGCILAEECAYDETLTKLNDADRFVLQEARRVGRPKSGYIYLLRGVDGYYKIGKALDPDERIGTLEVKLPFEIATEHLIPSDDRHQAETTLHKRYTAKRVRGEWFALTPDDVTEIKMIDRMNFTNAEPLNCGCL